MNDNQHAANFSLALANFWENYANGRYDVAYEQAREILKLKENPFKNNRAQVAFVTSFQLSKTLIEVCKDMEPQEDEIVVLPPAALIPSFDNLAHKN